MCVAIISANVRTGPKKSMARAIILAVMTDHFVRHINATSTGIRRFRADRAVETRRASLIAETVVTRFQMLVV